MAVVQAELAVAGVRPTPLAEGAQLYLTVDIVQVDDVDAARFGEVMVMLRVLHSSAVFMTPKHKGAMPSPSARGSAPVNPRVVCLFGHAQKIRM